MELRKCNEILIDKAGDNGLGWEKRVGGMER